VVNPLSGRKKLGNIALIIDERLSRDRRGTLSRVINALRHWATVELIAGEIEEPDLIKKLEAEKYSLVLAPWYRYLNWSRVEAHFGLTRSSGPTFAGYFCEPLKPSEIGPQADHLRAILLDFAGLAAHEAALLVRSLIVDRDRSGLRPMLDPTTPVYTENWHGSQGLGMRIDNVMGLPEIARHEWNSRGPAARILLSALWSLVYEEGPGKNELRQASVSDEKTPRACFQVAASAVTLSMRLCYAMPGWSAKDALAAFWPDTDNPTGAAQLLLKYSDALRVHTLSGTNDVEVVASLFRARPAEKVHSTLHTLWVEPLQPQLVSEIPFETPPPGSHLNPNALLKALPPVMPESARRSSAPGASSPASGHTAGSLTSSEGAQAKERFIFESAVKLRELKRVIADRDETIRELKAGGVGTATPLPPPDAEGLLEAFQQRYQEARFQIRQFELQIAELEQSGPGRLNQEAVQSLRLKMAALEARERAWIKHIGETIELFKAARATSGGGG
jgi:hypothetical protein